MKSVLRATGIVFLAVLFGVGLLLAAPFLFLGVIIWWLARRANRAATPSNPTAVA
jgi:hypothetical protein